MTGLTIINSLIITIICQRKYLLRTENILATKTIFTSKDILNSNFIFLHQVISMFHFSSLFKLEGPTKLPLTGATNSDFDEDAKAI